MGEVGKLAKDSKNEFAGYRFTSIDDFLVATNRICSENGLVVLQRQLNFETHVQDVGKEKKRYILQVTFGFTVYHESGEELPEVLRTVWCEYTGSQSFGSAQSYSQKFFLRSLFQIPTGDKDDADYNPPDVNPPPAAKKETPGHAKAMINPAQIKMIYSHGAELLPTEDIADAWIELTCKKPVGELTYNAAKKIIDFLVTNPKLETWPEEHKQARDEAIKNEAGI